jgi:hypothetical protein
MDLFKRCTKIGIVASSGILRVTVPPRRSWLLIVAAIAADVVFVAMVYSGWSQMPLWLRLFIIWVMVSGVLGLIYELSETQIMEFDALRFTVCKDMHGWERKHEYQVTDCSELEWAPASKGRSAGLQCKIGWRTVMLGKDMSEDEAVEVLTALQASLPGVAQKLCSYPNSKDHFITLGLGR